MSKSLGNTVDPFSVVKEYGKDPLRLYALKEVKPFDDSPFTIELFKQAYNAYLANGLGNLTSRIMKMAETNLLAPIDHDVVLPEWYKEAILSYDLKNLCENIWREIQSLDNFIQEKQPFKVVKEDKEKGKEIIVQLVKKLKEIAIYLEPIIPETAEKIEECIANNKMPDRPLFERKN